MGMTASILTGKFRTLRDRSDCTTLMQELRNGLPSPWLISMAVPSDPRSWGQGFDIPALAPLVDFMNVMTYDYYGTWSGATGHVSPMFQESGPILSLLAV